MPSPETQTQVKADGSFTLLGLRPGRVRLGLDFPTPRGFTHLRVERDGVDLPDGFEVRAGEQVQGLRVFVTYGTGILRGQVQFPDGARPPDTRLYVGAHRANDSTSNLNAEIDTLGRFVLENMSAGEYELTLYAYDLTPGPNRQRPNVVAKKTVYLAEDGEARVTLVFNNQKGAQ